MGSKTPESERRRPDSDVRTHVVGSGHFTKPSGASGVVHDELGGDDEDSDDDDDNVQLGLNDAGVSKKKKKKKNNKRKKKSKTTPTKQSEPPRVAVAVLWPAEDYPAGELVEYAVKNENLARTTSEETRHLLRVNQMDDEFLKDYRQAAEVHREVRAWTQKIAKPGVSMTEIAHEIEAGVRALTGHDGSDIGDPLKAGMGFPTGLCLNNVAAHWTPNAGGKEVYLDYNDVLKVDFGVHVKGRIVDSAFTIAHNPVYDNLLASVKDATNTGLKEAGIDVRISEISCAIQEAMESYEVELNGKVIPIKAVRNITGHDILRYRIHGGKQIPFIKSKTSQRMEEGEIFAIETFGSTGKAYLHDDIGVYGYGRSDLNNTSSLHQASARSLLKTIDNNFGTLVFAKRYLERVGAKNYLLPMKTLISQGLIDVYGPLSDIPGSYVAQFEHTVLLRPNCKEVISRGDDY